MARNLVTNVFSGSTPRQADHLVRNGAATKAIDCKLWHGTLESWRSTRKIHEVASNTKSIYQAFNCCWIESSKCASWAEGATEQQHIFATNYNEYAYPVRIVFDEFCDPTVYRLGLPCPTGRAETLVTATFSKGSAPRQYAFQYVDSFGNLSALSEPSEETIVEENTDVLVWGWVIPTGGWDVQQVRIYRTVAGYEAALKESENTVDAAWMLVDTIPATQLSYVDSKADFDLVESLGEDFVEPPPANLQGMTWIQSMNCLAGFAGRYLYFSQNNNYHNWVYKLQLDDTIRAITESNDTIYVATDGAPYVVPGAVDCKDAGCRRAIRMPEALPMIGAGYRSMTAVPSGAVYPTHHGLVYMSGKNAPSIVTSSHYAPDDWQALHPDTAKIGYHLGRLFCFFRNGAFCLAIKDGAGTNAELEHHTELSMRPDEIFVTRTGRLLLRFGINVEEWDRGNTLLPHTYESSENLIGVPFNFGALQVFMAPGNERIQLYCDDFPVLDESVFQNEHFALPLWATGQTFKWVLTGTAKVKMVSLAPSTKEL